jgi:hypothetical protein
MKYLLRGTKGILKVMNSGLLRDEKTQNIEQQYFN